MSQPSRILPQSKETLLKSYTKRLKDDVKSILDNFTEIVKSSKVSVHVKEILRECVLYLLRINLNLSLCKPKDSQLTSSVCIAQRLKMKLKYHG